MKKYILLFLTLFTFSFPVVAQVYQWVDEHGVTHFSETPRGTPEDIYPVTRDIKEKPADQESQPEKETRQQVTNNNQESATVEPGQGWPECESELCAKVKSIDVNCTTQDCTDAVKFSSDCKTVLCLADKIDFEKKIDAELQRRANENEVKKEPELPAQEDKEILSDKEVLARCKEERNVKCHKNLDYYRTIYNGTKEERKKARQELLKGRSARKEKKE